MWKNWIERKVIKLVDKQFKQKNQIKELVEVTNNHADLINDLMYGVKSEDQNTVNVVFEPMDMIEFAQYVLSDERKRKILSEPSKGELTKDRLSKVNREELSEWMKQNM